MFSVRKSDSQLIYAKQFNGKLFLSSRGVKSIFFKSPHKR